MNVGVKMQAHDKSLSLYRRIYERVLGTKLRAFLVLNLAFFIVSVGNVLSKLASGYEIASLAFVALYALAVAALGIGAIIYQLVLKRVPLSVAFACKSVTVVWGFVWAILIFGERVSFGMAIGALIVIAGIIVIALDEKAIEPMPAAPQPCAEDLHEQQEGNR